MFIKYFNNKNLYFIFKIVIIKKSTVLLIIKTLAFRFFINQEPVLIILNKQY